MMREEIGRVQRQRGRKGKYSVQHKRLRRDRWLREEAVFANFPTGFPPAEDVLCNAGLPSHCFVLTRWPGTEREGRMCFTVLLLSNLAGTGQESVGPLVTWILVSQSYSWSASRKFSWVIGQSLNCHIKNNFLTSCSYDREVHFQN